MQQIAKLFAAAGVATCALAGLVQPSAAQAYPEYLYCAHYGGGIGHSGAPGTPVCGFNTREQCFAAVSGSQGTCELNPWYQVRRATRRGR